MFVFGIWIGFLKSQMKLGDFRENMQVNLKIDIMTEGRARS